MRLHPSVFVVFLALTLRLEGPAQVEYSIVDLGVLPGADQALGTGMNELGDVTGWSTVVSAQHAFLYTDAQGMIDLGFFPRDVSSVAFDVNELREVVGESTWRSWRWAPTTGLVEYAPSSWTRPMAINNHGIIVGTLNPDAAFSYTTFSYDPARGVTALTPGQRGRMADVNERGQSVGWSSGHGGFRHTPGVGFEPLPIPPGFASLTPSAINSRGDVVGTMTRIRGDPSWEPFLYTDAGGTTMLNGGNLNGTGAPAAINDYGHIVGSFEYASGTRRPYIYTPQLGTRYLTVLVPPGARYTMHSASDINNAGQIVVNGRDRVVNQPRALRLDPIAPRASTFRVGTGCGARATPPELTSNPPALGSVLTLALDNGTAGAPGILALSIGPPQRLALGGGCTVYLDAQLLVPGPTLTADASGRASVALPIPPVPAMAGVRLVAQIALVSAAAPSGIDLSNGRLLVLGG